MKEYLSSRAAIIKKISHEKPHSCTGQVVHALFSCFTIDELCALYIESLNITDFRKQVQEHIIEAIEQHGATPFRDFIDKLFLLLEPFDTQQAISVNALLYRIIEHFPSDYIRKYFEILFNSHRDYDRHRAYVLSRRIWSPEIEERLWNRWKELREESCLKTLIEEGRPEDLISILRSVWEAKYVTDKTRRRLAMRIADWDFEAVEHLKDIAPVFYLYLAIRVGRNIAKDEALKLTLQGKNTDELGVAVWCLGQLKQWEAIIDLNSQIPELERSMTLHGSSSSFADFTNR
jgi:hypothetical protein